MFNLNFFKKTDIQKSIEDLINYLYRLNSSLDNLQKIYIKKKYTQPLTKKEEILLIQILNDYLPIEFENIINLLNYLTKNLNSENQNFKLTNFLNYLRDKIDKIETISLESKEYEEFRIELNKLIGVLIQIQNKTKKEKNKKIIISIIAGILISSMPYFFQKEENINKINQENQKGFEIVQKEIKPEISQNFNNNYNNITQKTQGQDFNNKLIEIVYKYNPSQNDLNLLIQKNKEDKFKKIFKNIKKKFEDYKKGNFTFSLKEFKNLKILAKYSDFLFEKGFINKRKQEDFKFIYKLISNKIKAKYVRIRVAEYISKNKAKFQDIDIEKHLFKRGKFGPELTGNIINLSNIDRNLSFNTYSQSKRFNLNLKLIASILLIENNYGQTFESSSGAKGVSQVKEELRKKYYPDDDSPWAYFMTTFRFLDDEPKKFGINLNKFGSDITELDFALAGLMYHEGTTRFLNKIDDILEGKGEYLEGRDYIDKLMRIYNYYKLRLNYDKGGKREILI